MMTGRKVKWYEPLPPRNWRENMIPNSRPSSHLSRSLQHSLQESDWSSIRDSSPRSDKTVHSYESPPRLSIKKKNPKIEQILNKSNHRPRSVSLTKYEPLPAINSDSAKSRISASSTDTFDGYEHFDHKISKRATSMSSIDRDVRKLRSADLSSEYRSESPESRLDQIDSDSSEDEHTNHEELEAAALDYEKDEYSGDERRTRDGRPKLIRSNTFEVIETNLLDLPVINDDVEDDTISTLDHPVTITVDGIPLVNFLDQSSDLSRPSSHTSLITHPGTPDSGLGVPSTNASNSSSALLIDDSNERNPHSNDCSFTLVLLDLSLDKCRISLNASLRDFLDQVLRFHSHNFYLIDDIDGRLLSKSLLHLGFGTIESVRLKDAS